MLRTVCGTRDTPCAASRANACAASRANACACEYIIWSLTAWPQLPLYLAFHFNCLFTMSSRKRQLDSPVQPPAPKRHQPTLLAFCKPKEQAEPTVTPPPAPPPEPVVEAVVEPPLAAGDSPLNDFGRCVGQVNLSDAQKHALIERHWQPKTKATTKT